MEPSRDTLAQLLELQKVDSTIDRLEARRRSLPELAELEELERRLIALESSLGEYEAVASDHEMRQMRLEAEADAISAKIASEEAKLYSGAITSPRELSDLQSEVEALRRRRSSLEDQELDEMEIKEAAEKRVSEVADEMAAVKEAGTQATARRDRATAAIDSELAAARVARSQWVSRFEADLVTLYEDLRLAKGGVAAAALVDGVCQGCHIRLASQEFERVRAATGLVRCDECRRILVVL